MCLPQMDKLLSKIVERGADSDLASRLARLRRSVEAEGRPHSVNLIDRAIREADKKAKDGK